MSGLIWTVNSVSKSKLHFSVCKLQGDTVLAAHDKELLAIPGVVGVYVGALNDGRTPCLKVVLAEKNHETERKIPQTLDGYPVITEVTGQIRPLDDR